MQPQFSTFESEVSHFLEANISIKDIIKYFKKPSRSIYDAIYRIKKKKKDLNIQERARKGRISKVSSRTRRAINRDITRSPKKT